MKMRKTLIAGALLMVAALLHAADTKISALSSGSPAQATDAIPISRAGANFRLAASDFCSAGGCSIAVAHLGTSFGPSSGTAASAGLYRLANNTKTCWRNAANDGDLCLWYDASNVFNIDGSGAGTIWTLTNVVAPGTPASGLTSIYVDSTSKNLAAKNDAGTVNHGVQTATCTNQFVTAISDAGAVTCGTVTLAGAQFANQGTTTTVLHGNAAGNPSFGAVVEADITTADNTTNDVTTSKHGFAPKAPNDATKFLDGTGAWTVPAGGSSPGFRFGNNMQGGGLASGATNYVTCNGPSTFAASESDFLWLVPVDCTAGNFYVVTSTAQSANNSMVFTVRVNGSDTAIVTTVAAGAASGTYSDTTHTAAVTAGSNMSVKIVNNANVGSAQIKQWAFECH